MPPRCDGCASARRSPSATAEAPGSRGSASPSRRAKWSSGSPRTDAHEPQPRIVLVQALAKGDRDELAVQAATELGVDEIVPWQAARSVSRWDSAKAEKGRGRWASIAREAAQAGAPRVAPDVAPLTDHGRAGRAGPRHPSSSSSSRRRRDRAHRSLDIAGPRVISCSSSAPKAASRPRSSTPSTAAGATLVRLGDTVLRTSTAGPAALAVVSAALGRW